jgi:PAS domain S-box-containing protein
MLCVAGMDGYFRRVNPAFERILGYSADELVARPFIDFVHPDDRERTLREVARLTTGVPTVCFENRYRCANGSYKDLAWTSMPVPEDGLLYAVARDVTEQKRLVATAAEAEIAAQRLAVLQATMRTVHDIVNNFLNGVLLIRDEAEGLLAPDSLALFDHMIGETTAKLKILGDLTTVTEQPTPIGAYIKYDGG